MTNREQLPRPFIVFAFTVAAAGLFALATTLTTFTPRVSIQLLLVLASTLVSEMYLLRLKTYSVSLAMPLILTSVVIGGPGAACLGAAASSVSPEDVRDRRPISLLVFNFGQLVLSSSAAGFTYLLAGGEPIVAETAVPLTGASVPGTLLAVVLAAVVFNSMNIFLMAIGVWLGRGVPFIEVVRDLVAPLPTQLALALVGLLMAQVLAISPIALPLFLFPLFLARQVFLSYATLRDAYFETVRSLIGALEAKDAYTRGHSERVADYACQLAEKLSLDSHSVETVQQAALLHDIGKLSLSWELLNKPSDLSNDEHAAIRRHPWTGGQMVLRIPALRPLADLIKAHHERLDGSGYPIGMRGEEIPLLARLLAIADAYDAMTTDRAYRRALTHEQAAGELVQNSGTQFDASLVAAFLECDFARPPLSNVTKSDSRLSSGGESAA